MKDHIFVLILLIIIIQIFILDYFSIKKSITYEEGENLLEFIDLQNDYEEIDLEKIPPKTRPQPIMTQKIEKNDVQLDEPIMAQKIEKNNVQLNEPILVQKIEKNNVQLDQPIMAQKIEKNNVQLDEPIKEIDKCVAREKVYFLKVHKTASSVIENILLRYAWTRNKTLVRPSNGGLNFDWNFPFRKGMAEKRCQRRL